MVILATVLSLLLGPAQSQAANPACSILTTAEVSSIIGAATTLPVTGTSTGGSCMYQHGDRMVTVLVAKPDSTDSAQSLWNAKKRIAAGADVPGWATPAYFASQADFAVLGVVKATTFIEVKVIDKTQKPEVVGAALKAAMKAVAARM